MKSYNKSELEKLREKILEAIRGSRRFWMTYRENTFGIASILNLIYKKSFIEVLFFTKKDIEEKGLPPIKIYSPLEKEIDFKELTESPDFDDDGIVSPRKTLNRLRRLIRREFQKHIARLENEVKLLDDLYENYQIGTFPYYREIRITFPDFFVELKINFEKYPLLPIFEFSITLSKILSEKEFSETEFIKNWNEKNPPHVYELIDEITKIICEKLQIKPLEKDSQFLIIDNVSLKDGEIKNISFKIHRGKSIGVILEEEQIEKKDYRIELLNLFEAVAGKNKNYTGTIKIFGKNIEDVPESTLKQIFIIPEAYESNIVNLKVKKAVKYKLNLKKILKERTENLEKIIKRADLAPSIDTRMKDVFKVSRTPFRKVKKLVDLALDSTGLSFKKNLRFSELTPLDFLQFSIARALLQNPIIIAFLIPFGILNKFDYDKFNRYITDIKKRFHLILMFHGPEEIVSNCDQILTITKRVSKIGSIDDYMEELPQYGEIFTLELSNPKPELIQKFFELKDEALIVEQRKNEKYKLFIKEDPNKMILKLIRIFGPNLFSFKRSKATLSEYLEYVQYIQS